MSMSGRISCPLQSPESRYLDSDRDYPNMKPWIHAAMGESTGLVWNVRGIWIHRQGWRGWRRHIDRYGYSERSICRSIQSSSIQGETICTKIDRGRSGWRLAGWRLELELELELAEKLDSMTSNCDQPCSF